MRMKKILILAVAATALVACAKSFDKSTSEGQAIGFGTWTEVMTKAVTPADVRKAGDNHFKSGDSFAVYGYKSAADDTGKSTVFDDDVVVATADNGTDATTWDYNNHRFWDLNFAKYTFFGVSPSNLGTAGTVDAQTGSISTSVEFAGNNNDVLIANKTVVEKGSTPYFNNYGVVNLVFNHAASLVDIIVKKSSALADPTTVNITAFELENILSKGTLAVSEYAASTPFKPTIALANWTGDGNTATYNPTKGATSITLPVVVVEDGNFPGDDASDVPADITYNKVINNLVVMPQQFAATGTSRQQIKMTYTITTTDAGSNTSTNTYADNILYLSDFDNIDDKAQDDTKVASWEPGKHYIFYITIDANEIKFSASINDWDTTIINGYHYLLN